MLTFVSDDLSFILLAIDEYHFIKRPTGIELSKETFFFLPDQHIAFDLSSVELPIATFISVELNESFTEKKIIFPLSDYDIPTISNENSLAMPFGVHDLALVNTVSIFDYLDLLG